MSTNGRKPTAVARELVGDIGGWLRSKAPREWQVVLGNVRTLAYRYGQLNTVKFGVPKDGDGEPLPWYTYPAIEYLASYDLSGRTVFEYGSGQSSAFWARRAARVISVEHDRAWYQEVKAKALPNHELELREDLRDYVALLPSYQRKFDVIVIDGRARTKCAAIAPDHLAPGGLLVFDNVDWYPRSAAILREAGLFQIDFNGFGPINGYTWTTSVFVRADTSLQRGYRAARPIGGIDGDGDSTD